MRDAYDHIARQWHTYSRSFRHQKYVDMILEGLQPGARILDLGCGTGSPVALYLISQGFRVLGVDRSMKMLEVARRAVPEAELIRGDMLELELGCQFAAAIAWDSIFHVERLHHRTIFRKLHQWLEPGGRLLLSIGGSGGEEFTSEMFGHTFFYSGYEPDVTLALLMAEGFRIDLWEVDDPSSRGHIAVIASKEAHIRAAERC